MRAGPIDLASDIADDPQYRARTTVPVERAGPDLEEHTHHVLTEILDRPCSLRACLPDPEETS